MNSTATVKKHRFLRVLLFTFIFSISSFHSQGLVNAHTSSVEDDPRLSEFIDIPESIGEFNIAVIDDEHSPSRAALRYDYEPTDERLTLTIRLGNQARSVYQNHVRRFVESDFDIHEVSIDGNQYLVSSLGHSENVSIIKYVDDDDKFINLNMILQDEFDPQDIPEKITGFMTEFDLDRVINWEIAPEFHEFFDEPDPMVGYFEELIPEKAEEYSLIYTRTAREEPGVRANYVHEGYTDFTTLNLNYGPSSENLHWAVEHSKFEFDIETHPFEVDGHTISEITPGNEHIFYKFVDDFALSVIAREDDDSDSKRQAMSKIVGAIDFDHMRQWEPPQQLIEEMDEEDEMFICENIVCFDNYVSECETAGLDLRQREINTWMQFMVDSETENGCKVEMQFTRNPNDDWVGETLGFTLGSDQSFKHEYQNIFEECLESDGQNSYNCTGDLMEVIHE